MTNKKEILAKIKERQQLIWPTNTGEMREVSTPSLIEQGWLNALQWMEGIIDSLPEETACEELDQASEKYADHTLAIADPEFSKSAYHRDTKMKLSIFNGSDIEVAFIAGANWQRNKMTTYMEWYKNEHMNCAKETEGRDKALHQYAADICSVMLTTLNGCVTERRLNITK